MSKKRGDAVGRQLFEALQGQAAASEKSIIEMEKKRTDPKYPTMPFEIERARKYLKRVREWAKWVGRRM